MGRIGLPNGRIYISRFDVDFNLDQGHQIIIHELSPNNLPQDRLLLILPVLPDSPKSGEVYERIR
jgi:hypothetical protein